MVESLIWIWMNIWFRAAPSNLINLHPAHNVPVTFSKSIWVHPEPQPTSADGMKRTEPGLADWHTHIQKRNSQTDLAAGEPSSICADTVPPCEGRADTCTLEDRDGWPKEHPVSPDTLQPPAHPGKTSQRQLRTVPNHGTGPHSEGPGSTPGGLRHSQWGRVDRRRGVLRATTHLGEDRGNES